MLILTHDSYSAMGPRPKRAAVRALGLAAERIPTRAERYDQAAASSEEQRGSTSTASSYERRPLLKAFIT